MILGECQVLIFVFKHWLKYKFDRRHTFILIKIYPHIKYQESMMLC